MDSYRTVPREFGVLEAIEPALKRVAAILFKPFDFATWIYMGVIIAFAQSFKTVGGGFNVPSSGTFRGNWYSHSSTEVSPDLRAAMGWAEGHMILLVTLVMVGLLIGAAIGLGLLYLSSRGRLMFVRAVATGSALIGENWRAVREGAWSLFMFRLVLAVAGLVIFGVLLGAGLVLVIPAFEQPNPLVSILPIAIVLGVVTLAPIIAFWLINTVLSAFIVPIMYCRDVPCLQAWAIFREAIRGHLWGVAGFILLRVVYWVLFGVMMTLGGCLTCCIGFLPVIHHIVFSPLFVFDRSYSMCLLASLGPEFDCFGAGALAPEPEFVNGEEDECRE